MHRARTARGWVVTYDDDLDTADLPVNGKGEHDVDVDQALSVTLR
jgi:hypothetical protein